MKRLTKSSLATLTLILGAAIALSISFSVLPAYAVPSLDFGVVSPTSGSISYSTLNGPLVGQGIDVDNVVGLGTKLNANDTLLLSNAFLNFTTGSLTATTGTSWTFGGGENTFITIIGDIADLNLNNAVLLTGRFGSVTVTKVDNTFNIAGALFYDTKDETLLNYFGLPTTLPDGSPYPYLGNFNISFEAEESPPNTFTSDRVFSGDIINTPVPEPASLLLLGSGIFGLAIYGRKKYRITG